MTVEMNEKKSFAMYVNEQISSIPFLLFFAERRVFREQDVVRNCLSRFSAFPTQASSQRFPARRKDGGNAQGMKSENKLRRGGKFTGTSLTVL